MPRTINGNKVKPIKRNQCMFGRVPRIQSNQKRVGRPPKKVYFNLLPKKSIEQQINQELITQYNNSESEEHANYFKKTG